MFRKAGLAIVTASLLITSVPVAAWADTATPASNTQPAATDDGPLAPGDAAGVKEAQGWMGSHRLLLLLGLGIVAGGVALALSDNHSSSATNTQ